MLCFVIIISSYCAVWKALILYVHAQFDALWFPFHSILWNAEKFKWLNVHHSVHSHAYTIHLSISHCWIDHIAIKYWTLECILVRKPIEFIRLYHSNMLIVECSVYSHISIKWYVLRMDDASRCGTLRNNTCLRSILCNRLHDHSELESFRTSNIVDKWHFKMHFIFFGCKLKLANRRIYGIVVHYTQTVSDTLYASLTHLNLNGVIEFDVCLFNTSQHRERICTYLLSIVGLP